MASDDGHCGLGRATRHGRGPLPRLSESGPPARVTQSPNSARPRPRGRGSDLLAAATRPGGSANTASSPAPVFRRRAVRSRPGPRSASSVLAAPSPSRGARSPGPRDVRVLPTAAGSRRGTAFGPHTPLRAGTWARSRVSRAPTGLARGCAARARRRGRRLAAHLWPGAALGGWVSVGPAAKGARGAATGMRRGPATRLVPRNERRRRGP